MKRHKKRYRASLLTAILALGTMLGACGTDAPTGKTVATISGAISAGTPTAGLQSCTTCHPVETGNWMTSRHANLDPTGNVYSAGVPTIGALAGCTARCHDPLFESQQLIASFTGNTVRPVVGCESCHGGGSLHAGAGGATIIPLLSNTTGTTIGSVSASGQFVMCTTCHELLDTAGTGTKADPAHATVTPTNTANYITDSHFASAGTWSNINGEDMYPAITGYAMDYADERVCSNCHNPHTPADINKEWASSRHADKGADKAWGHYNWSCDGSTSDSCGASSTTGAPSSRKSCNRCHSTTGYVALADALRAGNTSLANLIVAGTYTIPNFFTTAWKPEMLQCKACHTDINGSLRDPGAFNASYGGTITHQYDDLGGSNICMPCHTGRKAGSYITLLTKGFKNSGGMRIRDVETHYLVAAGTMFKSIGYEYPGREYSNTTAFKHDKIGTAALSIDGGANGPCVGCHMYRPGGTPSHLFKALNVTGGLITGVASDVCFNVTCHPGSNAMLTEIAEVEKSRFESALKVLSVQLATSGFSPYPGPLPLSDITSPYFGTPAVDKVVWDPTDDSGNTVGKNNIGAAYNFLMLHDDPGAYVHNNKYTKRLIYDAIDWLDDNQMNYSVGATIPSLASGLTSTEKTDAAAYLIPLGSEQWQGTYPEGYGLSTERP